MKKILASFESGLFSRNPMLIQLLGLCPALAVTTSAVNAIGMGIAVMAVLISSNVFISLLRKIIPHQIRIAAYIVLIGGFVTIIEIIIRAYFPLIDRSLGIFIPLIVCNCLILGRAEAFASKNKLLPSFVDGLAMGGGFFVALFVIGAIREILGSGSIFGVELYAERYHATFFILPAGAFITMGVLIAIVQFFYSRIDDKRKTQERISEEQSKL